MTIFTDLSELISAGEGALENFNTAVEALTPLLGDEDDDNAIPIPLDDYICVVVSQCAVNEAGATDEPNQKPSQSSSATDAKAKSSGGKPNLSDSENPIEKISPLEELHTEIAFLKKQMVMLEHMQKQMTLLPSKDDLVSAVIERIELGDRKYRSADSPEITRGLYD